MSTPVTIFARRLAPTSKASVPSDVITLRCFQNGDESNWLELHRACFTADHRQHWTKQHFRREFLTRPWWDVDRMWFAVVDKQPVGSVVVGEHAQGCASLQWLMVLKEYRRRGIGRHLAIHAEVLSARLGYQSIRLETLDSWKAAVSLYKSLDYQVVT